MEFDFWIFNQIEVKNDEYRRVIDTYNYVGLVENDFRRDWM